MMLRPELPRGMKFTAVNGNRRGDLEALEFDVVVDVARIRKVITARRKPVRIGKRIGVVQAEHVARPARQ